RPVPPLRAGARQPTHPGLHRVQQPDGDPLVQGHLHPQGRGQRQRGRGAPARRPGRQLGLPAAGRPGAPAPADEQGAGRVVPGEPGGHDHP
ncbi:unnamed protein product, partial [Prorocentrum cordatum]